MLAAAILTPNISYITLLSCEKSRIASNASLSPPSSLIQWESSPQRRFVFPSSVPLLSTGWRHAYITFSIAFSVFAADVAAAADAAVHGAKMAFGVYDL